MLVLSTPLTSTIRHLRRRLRSRQWWTFLSVHAAGAEALQHIEETYFADDEELYEAFVLIGGPAGAVAVFLAAKSLLPAEALATALRRSGVCDGLTAAELREHDVIAMTDRRCDGATAEAAARYLATLLAADVTEWNWKKMKIIFQLFPSRTGGVVSLDRGGSTRRAVVHRERAGGLVGHQPARTAGRVGSP